MVNPIAPGLARTHGTWVQTDRSAHEAWSKFLALKGATAASRVLHVLIARMGEKNAVVISQGALADELGVDPRTIRRAIAMLRDHQWIQTINLGGAKSGVQAYIVNSRVAWQGARDGIRHSVFDATVYATEQEQEDGTIDSQVPLHRLPALYPEEMQLPSGDGLPPISQPALPGMDHDLPARGISRAENSEREELPARPRDNVENWTREELEEFARRSSGNSPRGSFLARGIQDFENSPRAKFSEREIDDADEGKSGK